MKYIEIKNTTSIVSNNSVEGVSLEVQIERALNNKEPLDDETVPLIYTERKAGLMPAYDIRKDKWEIAQDAMEKVTQLHISHRTKKDALEAGKEGETQSTEGTNN